MGSYSLAGGVKAASGFEILAARLWNVLNEGKSFHPVFVLGVFLLLHVGEIFGAGFWGRALPALLLVVPLVLVFVRYDFPLKLRWALWVALAAFVLLFRFVDVGALTLALGLYVFFTVFFWGTFYYHLRTGAPKTNFLRFWKLVLENPDSTSGNFLEQVPKALLVLFALEYLVSVPLTAGRAGAILVFTATVGVASWWVHRRFFDWKPVYPSGPTGVVNRGAPLARRVIVVVIDGCRLDSFNEAQKPYLEKMMAGGTVYESVETVYPARTVVCFSSMLTGAAPERHGITSNLVLKLGLKVESVFDVLRGSGKKGRLVGIAHLIDAFGGDVASVTSVAHNDKIDANLIAAGRRELEEHDPELLVLQLLAVDQNGHVRGTRYPEYVERIEITDNLIEGFMSWCRENGYLEDTAVVLMADHGQGIGIGAHGHLSEGERFVPFAMWGNGIAPGRTIAEPASVMDLAPTICYLLGVAPPKGSTGRVLEDALEEGR
ncbi:MAG: alkaline phosphatase family protein [Actinomycetota bacterium]|nr:alkaline phosphatase family protein [Actinomycetota bacterium]MDQ3429763.1 alkaline phosphatase family protein [Actinomycetota bacterium]